MGLLTEPNGLIGFGRWAVMFDIECWLLRVPAFPFGLLVSRVSMAPGTWELTSHLLFSWTFYGFCPWQEILKEASHIFFISKTIHRPSYSLAPRKPKDNFAMFLLMHDHLKTTFHNFHNSPLRYRLQLSSSSRRKHWGTDNLLKNTWLNRVRPAFSCLWMDWESLENWLTWLYWSLPWGATGLFLNFLETPTLPFGTQFRTHLRHGAHHKPSLPLEEVILPALVPCILAFNILYVKVEILIPYAINSSWFSWTRELKQGSYKMMESFLKLLFQLKTYLKFLRYGLTCLLSFKLPIRALRLISHISHTSKAFAIILSWFL